MAMLRQSRLDDPVGLVEEAQRRNFFAFLIGAFPLISGGADLKLNWHLDAIAHQLDSVRKGKSRRLLVTMPPRNLKSISISVAWVAWCLGQDPTLEFVCVSYANELALKHARDCRTIMQSEWYKRLFPGTRLSRERLAVHDFETTAGGGRYSTSITGTLTGRGGAIVIIDDPVKPDEAMSDTVREAVNDWYRRTLASRLDDKQRGAIIVVMQRLHEYDLVGMLLEAGGWDHLNLPAIATDDQRVPLTRGRFKLRKPGDILHPENEPLDILLELKATMGSATFQAQYLQDPVPAEGNMIRAAWLARHDLSLMPGAAEGRIVQSWDTASKDGVMNDWSVCVTALVRGRQTFVLDVWRRRVEFPDLLKHARAHINEWRPQVTLIEDAASGEQLLQSLRKEPEAHLTDIIRRRPEGDKKSRVAGVSSMIESGNLLLPHEAGWKADFEAELLAFPSGRFDDQVDALSQLLAWVRQNIDMTVPLVGPILFGPDGDPINDPFAEMAQETPEERVAKIMKYYSDDEFEDPPEDDDCLYP